MALFNKGVIWYIVVLVIVIVIWYYSTGFKIPSLHPTTTTAVTTTVTGKSTTTITNTASTSTIPYSSSCDGVYLYTSSSNSNSLEECAWTGGYLGLWVASGNSQWEKVTVTGADNHVYMNQTSNYQCQTFFANFTAPAQDYFVTLTTGPPLNNGTSATCVYASATLNKTLSPPPQVYTQLYNGNFSNGAYTGWNVTGKGFGTKPLNITAANKAFTGNAPSTNSITSTSCYLGAPWRNYIGSYVATTYNCGTSQAPGNLTSSLFYAGSAFLNFRLISPQDNLLYIEILYNGSPAVIAHYNTYNVSYANASSTFRNVSIPLVTVINKPIQIRVVADSLTQYHFIAVGDFALSNRPNQDPGLSPAINFT